MFCVFLGNLRLLYCVSCQSTCPLFVLILRQTAVVGSPLWVAPEVVGSGGMSPKVDVWSFGIVLLEMETKNVPYAEEMAKDGANPTNIMLRVESEGLRPKIPKTCLGGVRDLILRCLQTNPAERPTFEIILAVLADPILRRFDIELHFSCRLFT